MTPFQKILNQVIEDSKQDLQEKPVEPSSLQKDMDNHEDIANLPSQNTNYVPTIMLKRKPF